MVLDETCVQKFKSVGPTVNVLVDEDRVVGAYEGELFVREWQQVQVAQNARLVQTSVAEHSHADVLCDGR